MFLVRLTMAITVMMSTAAVPQTKSANCKLSTHGFDYVGDVAETAAGVTCQRWDTQTPHSHSFTDARQFPDDSMADVGNKCRNPDHEEVGPWCYTTSSGTRWDYCLVDGCHDFQECKWSESGVEYRGSIRETQTGAPCVRWDSITGDTGNTSTLDSDYCRNPDGKSEGPWCYTSDLAWDYCSVSFCKVSAPCKISTLGSEYVGTIGLTDKGRQCQRWDKQYPHSHPHNDASNFPDATLEDANNYCRNPDNEPQGPWCYTTDSDVRWEYCGIPTCQDCKVSPSGIEYSGVLSQTSTGNTCQRWDSQSPHTHNMTDPNRFPDATLGGASNYCRNPDGKGQGPWCFTTNSGVEWEYCNIPECSGCAGDTPKVPLTKHVIQIGIDGLHPCFVNCSTGAPNIMQRLGSQGTYTLSQGRTVLKTVSGPGWTAQLCGLDVESAGVTGNSWVPPYMLGNPSISPVTGRNVPMPCGFSVLKGQDSNIRTAAFYDWNFLAYHMNFGNPGVVDKEDYCKPSGLPGWVACDIEVADDTVEYLRQVLTSTYKSYTFMYQGAVDETGHALTWCNAEYMNQVDATDRQVGQVLDLLDELGLADDVMVILSTDHGGLDTGHGREADSDLIIPMFIRGPGIRQGHQFTSIVRNLDMLPTIAHALGVKPSPWWSGKVMTEAFVNNTN